ncbi:MAG: FAD-binding protein [Myxococcales bacterium]|nr:FAD-binding protein [Myxococcota bacterium]MDW8282924.1 FAD-binding protein [Myxococcales bacterium]
MGNVLIVLEHTGERLRPSALSAITFGQQAQQHQGGKLLLLLIGDRLDGAAREAATFGADAVLVASAPALHPYLAETWAPVVARAAREQGATLVGAIATAVGKDLMPRVGALLQAAYVSDITSMIAPRSFTRTSNAGNVIQTVEAQTDVVVVSARQTEFAHAKAAGGGSPIVSIDPGPVDPLGAEFVELRAEKRERPDLTEARIVVSGGRGMREAKNFKYIEEICDYLGAAMGASRAACDAGMVPNDLQVGQTGKVVAPDLYIAVAISGAIQHLAGMKGSKVIVAINKDPEAPIFQVADYGLVTTWEKALPELAAELKKLTAAQA